MVTGVLKRAERKCVDKIGWLQILTFEKCTVTLKEWIWLRVFYRNNYSTLKERIAGTNIFWK